jgi:hypothetical protein
MQAFTRRFFARIERQDDAVKMKSVANMPGDFTIFSGKVTAETMSGDIY